METSQTIGKISEALAKAQGMMKPAVFDASNPHFKSRYVLIPREIDLKTGCFSQFSLPF